VEGQTADLSDERAVAALFTRLGPIDHLVFTASDSLQLHEFASTDLMLARRAFELRHWSSLAAVEYASPHIRRGRPIVLTTGRPARTRPAVRFLERRRAQEQRF
jgi:NAD(P)-dependent dehydrogenase (short-subunit alcohol dehydrogenase family)